MTHGRILVLRALCCLMAIGVMGGCATNGTMSDGEARPWTAMGFKNDPNDFQFAIVSDRCGGHRPGVFASAMGKINSLQPEFVMSVGDLVEGYTDDTGIMDTQWDELLGIVSELDMRFFFVPGNHDIGKGAGLDKWKTLHGDTHYSFVYGDVLFLCLNSIDGDGAGAFGISAAQQEWARGAIERNKNVRWTMVFMHVPLWLHDEGDSQSARKKITKKADTGFADIQEALEGRDYTVIAGHYHQYFRYQRHKQRYYILASTGGNSELRGPEHGEFDHVTWVTMTDDGPIMANLLLDGILPDDVHTEEHMQVAKSVKPRGGAVKITDLPYSSSLTMDVTNAFDKVMDGTMTWEIPEGSGWAIEPADATFSMDPRAAHAEEFKVSYSGSRRDIFPTPGVKVSASIPGSAVITKTIYFPMDKKAFLAMNLPTAASRKTKEAITPDGILDEDEWDRRPDLADMRLITLRKDPEVPTAAWVAYDDEYLYLAVRCAEPNQEGMQLDAIERDGPVWNDDSIEIFLDMDVTRETYHQVIANANGVICDSLARDGAWNGNYKVGPGREVDGWTIELAIPWADLGRKGSEMSGKAIGFNLVRTRTQNGEIVQWSPTAGGNHVPDMFGTLKFE